MLYPLSYVGLPDTGFYAVPACGQFSPICLVARHKSAADTDVGRGHSDLRSVDHTDHESMEMTR